MIPAQVFNLPTLDFEQLRSRRGYIRAIASSYGPGESFSVTCSPLTGLTGTGYIVKAVGFYHSLGGPLVCYSGDRLVKIGPRRWSYSFSGLPPGGQVVDQLTNFKATVNLQSIHPNEAGKIACVYFIIASGNYSRDPDMNIYQIKKTNESKELLRIVDGRSSRIGFAEVENGTCACLGPNKANYSYDAKGQTCGPQVNKGCKVAPGTPGCEPTVFSGCGGWVHYPEIPTCLKVVHELKTWKEARAVCNKIGGDLVAILTPGLDALLTNLSAKENQSAFWIGLSDHRNEDRFIWARLRRQSRYFNWEIGSPNGGISENCVEKGLGVNGTWDDVPCNVMRKFICERSIGTGIGCGNNGNGNHASGVGCGDSDYRNHNSSVGCGYDGYRNHNSSVGCGYDGYRNHNSSIGCGDSGYGIHDRDFGRGDSGDGNHDRGFGCGDDGHSNLDSWAGLNDDSRDNNDNGADCSKHVNRWKPL
ncbi:C-type lectin [Plakobranchus ocellatus]|uniref:C-type lectin n=1 Tax=Plakobranchus ocellatus TaxID=259542 RepID=A0AAV4AZ89_9GAST|nr:C-type lectin [Plakobranchus ocellatus]